MDKELLKLPICPKCVDTKYVTDRWCNPLVGSYHYICFRCCLSWRVNDYSSEVETDDWLSKQKHETLSKSAYQKWIDAGKPTGRDKEFWIAAEEEYYSQIKSLISAKEQSNDCVLI